MRTKQSQLGDFLMRAAPEAGQAVVLKLMSEAAQSLANGSGRRPGDELNELTTAVQDGTMRAYMAQGPNSYAVPVTDATVWRKPVEGMPGGIRLVRVDGPDGVVRYQGLSMGLQGAVAGVFGLDGLAGFMRTVADSPAGLGELDEWRLAVRVDELQAFESKRGGEAAAPADWIVFPEGGSWPHKAGAAWVDSERDAMFRMRHKHKVSIADLVEIVGVTRQAIDAQIGGITALRSRTYPGAWRPSPELLSDCGGSLQPLQAVVASMTGGAR